MRYLLLFVFFSLLTACGHHRKEGYVDTTGMHLELLQLEDSAGVQTFRAKLYLKNPATPELKNSLWYHADSSFYLFDRQKRYVAALIQPVNNGVANTYEYLVTFDKGLKNNEQRQFIFYDDRYIGHKVYQIELNH